jgi:hypothetical protein
MLATVALWVWSYHDVTTHPQAWGMTVRDDLAYFIGSHNGRIILAEHRITPATLDRAGWRVFVAGYGRFEVTLPDGRLASEHECYPSFLRQTPTEIPCATVASDDMFIGRGGPPPNVVRASIKTVSVPCWPWPILFAALGVSRCVSGHRHRRLRAVGHCVVCGYDLRATRERCPECGTPSASSGQAAVAPTLAEAAA